MIAPGAKGWLNKYLEMLAKNHFDLEIPMQKGFNKKEQIHFSLLRTGIPFGVPAELLFAKQLDDSSWTKSEKLKVLFFESLLFIYQHETNAKPFVAQEFKDSLLHFYQGESSPMISKVLGLFLAQKPDERLESILTSRLNVKYKVTEGKFWVNYLSNAFVYLDVLLYRQFLKHKQQNLSQYAEMADNALIAITIAAFSDDILTEKEKSIFKIFLDSANLNDSQKSKAKERLKIGAKLTDFSEIVWESWLFKRFLIDIFALTIVVNQETVPEDNSSFLELCACLKVPKKEVNYAVTMLEEFVLRNSEKEELLSGASSYEKLYGSLTKKWTKILGRNKNKIAKELKESKELVFLISKSTKTDLTKEEKELVKTQFFDLAKSIPALAIFLLPGGAILLPLVLKILPDLIPSAFRENRLDKVE